MKIAIMSDSHDNWPMLEKAIEHANELGCELLLHAGDLIAPPGIPVLAKFKGDVKIVWGNNEAEKLGIKSKADDTENIEICGDIYEDEVDGARIFMNHYPKVAELAAKSGDYDVVIYGHTHEVDQQTINDTLMINPGEIQGYLSGKSTYIVMDTDTNEVELVELAVEQDL